MKLGIDIGGTYLRYEIREDNHSIKKGSFKSTEIGLCAFVEKMLTQEEDITAVFISYAGQVRKGVILDSPHIKIDRHNIRDYIQHRYDVELFIENDLNCAVLAEAKAHDSQDICALYVGTGLGLGVLSGSRLIKGSRNIATELGHIPYKEAPFVCNCGKRNCIELFCSGNALLRWKQYYDLSTESTLQEFAQSKNDKAQQIYDEFLKALLYAAGTTITLFNPEILILGGGVLAENTHLLAIVEKKITAYALPLAAKNLQISLSQLEDAPLEGAFLLKDYHD